MMLTSLTGKVHDHQIWLSNHDITIRGGDQRDPQYLACSPAEWDDIVKEVERMRKTLRQDEEESNG